jgi:hypothetical protein
MERLPNRPNVNKRFLAVACAFLLVFVACGGGRKTGSEELLEEVGESEEGCRLGQNCTPTPSPQAAESTEKVGVGEQKAPEKEAPAQPQEQFFDIHLVGESPYYFDASNGQAASAFRIPLGYTLRVSNKDTTDTRPTRSFTASNGAFSSPDMKPGESWTFKFSAGGSFDLVDRCCPYVNGKLTVG